MTSDNVNAPLPGDGGVDLGERGAIAVFVALLIPVLLVFTALAVDVSRWYVETQRLQRAADAAALAGAPFMPDNLASGSSKAVAAAVAAAGKNGYTITGSNVQQGPRASQIRVTVQGTVTNAFGSLVGLDTTTIRRSALAEFTGPAPMGSPCNTFGNEPVAGVQGPSGSVLGQPYFPSCDPSIPRQFWAKIQGPNTGKIDGDRHMTRVCGTRGGSPTLPDGCTSSTNNTEFRPEGYFFLLRVGEAARGQDITFQVYDPAWVFSGPRCDALNDASSWANNLNPYTNDAQQRYRRTPSGQTPNEFCNGDYDPASGGPPRPAARLDTTFTIREPDESLNPMNGNVLGTCTTQFRGYSSAPTRDQLRLGSGSYDEDLARVFHQWYTLCTIDDAKAGDYYVQVRTNRKLPDSGTRGIWGGASGAAALANATSPDDETAANGRGSNSFAMRAFVAADPTKNSAVSVAGQDRMPIFMNASSGNATFNLIRVTPGAAGSTIRFTVYDVGDAASSGTVTVLPPTEANLPAGSQPPAPNQYSNGFGLGTAPIWDGFDPSGNRWRVVSGCSSGNVNVGTNLSNCSVGISNSVNNGRVQEMTVPIPTNYNCDALQAGGCWFRLNVRFGTGTVNDITTWTAVLDGDPVRLEE